MHALANPLSRVGFGSILSRYVREYLRTLSQVREVGADKSFIEAVALVEAWHEKIELPDGCGGRMFISGCARCKSTNVLTLPYECFVFHRSTMGRKHGTFRFRLPSCSRCDRMPPPAELVRPILVYR